MFISAVYFRPGKHAKLDIISTIIAAVGSAVAMTSLNVQSVTPRLADDGSVSGYNVSPGPLNLVVSLAVVILSGVLIYRVLMAYRTTDTGKKKALRLVLRVLAATLAVLIITNVVIPTFGGGSDLANVVSNVAITFFVLALAYSVLKYSFLDIRLLVMRSVGYVAGLVSLLVLVGVLQIGLFSLVGGEGYSLSLQQQFVLVALFVLVAVGFGPLRDLFAKITARLFFQDAYDQASFISQFNTNLIKNIELDLLLKQSAHLIGPTLKASYCALSITTRTTGSAYFVANSDVAIHSKDIDAFIAYSANSEQRVLIRNLMDSSTDEGEHKAIAKLMDRYDADALVALKSPSDSNLGQGFILLGAKRNGDVYNKTDVETLSIIANELVLAAQNALRFQEIEQFNTTLQTKVDDATRQLRRTNEKLRQMDQTKDDFISMASHQLRTPLTSVKGYVSMVLEGDAGEVNPLQRKLLNQSFVSAQRMVYLISDLLNVSRLRTGKFLIEPVRSNLAQVIQDEVEQLQETAKGRNLTVTYSKPEHFPILMLDETKLRQVIMNFMDNAIYYTPSGGEISVHLEERPLTIEFTVVDNGIGVPRHEQHHLFSKFYRAHNAKRARPDGTGLGLFMAKKVIVAQGGAIIFKSKEKQGSTFGFTFAKQPLLPPEEPAVVAGKAASK